MKLSCAFSIVVLFVTGLNIPLVASQTSTNVTSTAANTTAASTSATSTAANTTAASTSNTTTVSNAAASSASNTSTAANTTAAASTSTPMSTSQTTTAMTHVCIAHTCNATGCLTNASSYCNGTFCTMVQRFTVNQASYNITAGCASSCTAKDGVDGDFTVRTRCCQTDKCNNNDTQIAALPSIIGGSASNQAPLWILSIMLFISAFEILM